MKLNVMTNMKPRNDSSIDYISDDGYIVNIFTTIEWDLELTNSIWGQIFLSSFTSNDQLISVIEYMIECEKIIKINNKLLQQWIK